MGSFELAVNYLPKVGPMGPMQILAKIATPVFSAKTTLGVFDQSLHSNGLKSVGLD